MKAINSAWKSLTDTLRVVRRSGSCGVLPLLSYNVLLLIAVTALVPLFADLLGMGQRDVPAWAILFFAVFLAYGLLYLVIAFGNVALVVGIAARLDGQDPGLSVGFARGACR